MADGPRRIPRVLHQPPSVDFIENRLPELHPAFKNLPVRYDQALKRFVLNPEPVAMSRRSGQLDPSHDGHGNSSKQSGLQDRVLSPPIYAMKFWGGLLEKSLEQLRVDCPQEPERLQEKPEYSIRTQGTWADIYKRLQCARVQYDGTKSGFLGRFKRGYRRLADQSAIANQTLEMIPDNEYVSPVKAAVQVLVFQVASNARQEITATFEEGSLEDIFAKIEVFVATFPKDENITSASVNLLACILKAIEEGIAFFLSHTLIRAGKAAASLFGVQYQKQLLDSIAEIEVNSTKLVEQAKLSHIAGTRQAINLILEGIEQITLIGVSNKEGLKIVVEKTDRILQQNVQILHGVQQLRTESKSDSKYVEGLLKQVKSFLDEDEIRRTRTPSPAPSPQPPWSLQFQPPPPYPQYLQPWPIPGDYGWMHQQQMNLKYHQAQLPQPTIHTNAILAVLPGLNLDRTDIDAIMELGEAILLKYRKRTQQIVVSKEFCDWARSANSCKLLIQGDAGNDSTQAELAMALVSASLMQSLRSRDHFISLVFFCGKHLEPEDEPLGATAMASSFIAQLLQQHYADTAFKQQDLDLESLQAGDIGVLCTMFERLVRQLPREKTLVCVIDAVDAYETEELEADMRTVLRCLLRLVQDRSVSPAIKVLVTSPAGTIGVHEEFGDEDESILLMESLQSSGEDAGIWELEGDPDEES
ncbi:hypothetical protein K458DRAFT_366444 [Lentithecium fluviatile CBS 122367]|uniref:Nephrocystin 3-like N-terminal domain-containing protein n=1 Tax=Lentithecium fluviatile CBS 122367 TaxID=1168545 RepID=A0A6G1J497_9PLEO|nr:hypothetical protein K458DRAFT_366444 [Lentithecium fluviatile CBS 122367]